MPVRIPTQVYYNRRSSLPAQPRSTLREGGHIQVESQVFYNQARSSDRAATGPSSGRRSSTEPHSGRRSSTEPHGVRRTSTEPHGGQRSGSVSSGGAPRHRRRSSSSQTQRPHPQDGGLNPRPHIQQEAGGGGRYEGHPPHPPARHHQYSQPNLVYLRRASYAPPGSTHPHVEHQLSHEQWLSLQGLGRRTQPPTITYVRRASQSNTNPRKAGQQQPTPGAGGWREDSLSSSPGSSVVYLRRTQQEQQAMLQQHIQQQQQLLLQQQQQQQARLQQPLPPHPPNLHPPNLHTPNPHNQPKHSSNTQHPTNPQSMVPPKPPPLQTKPPAPPEPPHSPPQHPPPPHPPPQHPSNRTFSPPDRSRPPDHSRRLSSPGPRQRTREGRGKEKKKSKKQKQKELNQKGESKEGSDMDAFSLPPSTHTPPQQQQQPPVTQAQAAPTQQQTAPVRTDNGEEVKEEEEEPVAEPDPAPAQPDPAPAQPDPAPVTEVVTEEPAIEKVEITVVEAEKVSEKNEKNEEPWRKIASDEPWRKPKSTSNESSWRSKSNVGQEERRSVPREDMAANKTNSAPTTVTCTVDAVSSSTSENNAVNQEKTSSSSSSSSTSTSSKVGGGLADKPPTSSTTSSRITDNSKPVIDRDSSDLKHKYREGASPAPAAAAPVVPAAPAAPAVEQVEDNNRAGTPVPAPAAPAEAPIVNNDSTSTTAPTLVSTPALASLGGRKSYDRNFLLQMQFSSESLEKPDGLPRLPDVILDKPISRTDNLPRPTLKPGSMVDFTPGFFKTTPAGGKGGSQSIGRNRSQQKNVKGDGPKRIIITPHLDTKLHHSQNAWKPHARRPEAPKEGKEGPGETDELLKTVRAILNKLTPEKFQTLVKQIVNLKLDTYSRLKHTIDLVFEKAVDEPAFSSTYANLCKCMCTIKVPSENKPDELVAFKKLLLVRCQMEFEKDRTDEVVDAEALAVIEEKKKQLSEVVGPKKELEREILILEEEYKLAEMKSRRRYLGNIRFIGELFKLGILNEPIMHSCLQRLLTAMDEESLECLCRLLTTIGKSIDTDEKDKRARIDEYFNKLSRLSSDKKISARIRFMIQDVIDLRLSRWIPRRDDNKPKTIRELHKEIQIEDQHKQQNLSNILQMSKPTGGHHGSSDGARGRRGRGAGGVNEDGWQAVASKPLRTQTIEPNKMNQIKLSRHNMDSDNITLGSSFSSWGRGSSGGGGKSSREERSLSSTPNRFSPLSNERNPGRDGYEQGRSGSVGRGGLSQSRDRDRERGGDRDRGDRGGDRGGAWTTQTGRGKNVPRASQEHDREAAISAVRNMAGSGRSSTPTGSRNQSLDKGRQARDGPRGGADSRGDMDKAAPSAASPKLSSGEVRKKTEALLAEYLGLLDVEEAIQCVKELESPSLLNVMVDTALNHTIEKSQKARHHTGKLMAQLILKKHLTPEQYLAGLDEVLEFAEDMAIDIPKIWQYLGELVAPLVEERAIKLAQLSKSCEMIRSSGKAGVLMAEALKDIASRKGQDQVTQMWAESRVQWSDLIGDKDVAEFAKSNNIEYLSKKRIEDEMMRLIVEEKASNEVVFEWVASNVGDKPWDAAFTRALMTAVCSSAITENSFKVDPQVIKRRCAMMMKYLDHDAELELQALYALQALVHGLQHPAGLLRCFFDVLYDEDIISEDAFLQWAKSTDPAEQAGKGVAQSSVVQFFTWLQEAEEEGTEDN